MCTQADPGQALGLDVGWLVAAAGCVAYAKNSSTRMSIWANRVTRFDCGAFEALVARPVSFGLLLLELILLNGWLRVPGVPPGGGVTFAGAQK